MNSARHKDSRATARVQIRSRLSGLILAWPRLGSDGGDRLPGFPAWPRTTERDQPRWAGFSATTRRIPQSKNIHGSLATLQLHHAVPLSHSSSESTPPAAPKSSVRFIAPRSSETAHRTHRLCQRETRDALPLQPLLCSDPTPPFPTPWPRNRPPRRSASESTAKTTPAPCSARSASASASRTASSVLRIASRRTGYAGIPDTPPVQVPCTDMEPTRRRTRTRTSKRTVF